MEDILASIRRILSEDEAEPTAQAQPPHQEPEARGAAKSDVLALDASMLVDDPTGAPGGATPQAPQAPLPPFRQEPPLPALHEQHAPEPRPSLAAPAPLPPSFPLAGAELEPWPSEPARHEPEALLAPEASAAAVSSMGSLLRTLIAERHQVAVHRTGPSIEDVVREEVRPLLKLWLDTNLPPLVERLVRTEIERVVGRALS